MSTSPTQCTASPLASPLQAVRCGYRLFNYAVVDFVASAIPLMAAARAFDVPVYRGAAAVLPLSIAIHAVFAIDTPLTLQFFSMDEHFGVKVATLLSLYVMLEGNPF